MLARFGCPLSVLVLLASGCSEWPRYAHLPESDPDALTAGDDLGDLFELSWTEITEPSRTDDPTDTFDSDLAHGTAVLIHGSLDGTGWYDDASSVEFTDPDCPGAVGARSPMSTGDYIGDVDFYSGTLLADGQICATVSFGADNSHGWDLMLATLDECGVPTGYALAPDDTVLGMGLGGTGGGWGYPVASGDRIAVVLAAYYPNDLEIVLDYDLGISLVNTDSDGTLGPCPSLPEEAQQ